MEEKYVSVKPTTTIITLFERIVEMEGGVEGFDRQAIFNRVLLYTKDLTDNQLIAPFCPKKPSFAGISEILI